MSNELFLAQWQKTGMMEAGYVNDPNDSGGETNHGITLAVARAFGYTGDMKDLPITTAVEIAKQKYWDVMLLDDVGVLSAAVADKLFDCGFLCGIQEAGLIFQRAINLFSRPDTVPPAYPIVTEDGHVGKMTVYSFSEYLKLRAQGGEAVILKCINDQEGTYFMELCRSAPKDSKFVFGWYQNRIQ